MTKYRELKGLFKSTSHSHIHKDYFLVACMSRAIWTDSLKNGPNTVYREKDLENHFKQLHDNLTLPLEFIT